MSHSFISANLPKVAADGSKIRRYLFVASLLPCVEGISHHPYVLRQLMAFLQADKSCIVGVVLTGEMRGHPGAGDHWALVGRPKQSVIASFQRTFGDWFGTRLFLILGNTPYDTETELTLKSEIDSFCPEMAFCWLGLFEVVGLRTWLYERFPIAVLQFSCENFYTEPCDTVGLTNGLRPINSPPIRRRVVLPEPTFGLPERFAIPRTPECQWEITTVLQWHRLEEAFKAYGSETKNALVEVLKSGVRWRMVGVDTPSCIIESDPRIAEYVRNGQLVLERYDHRLAESLGHTKVLFFPPGVAGGGGAGKMAVSVGVPVLAPADANVANFIGPDQLFSNLDDMIHKISRLLCDEAFRLSIATAQQEKLLRDNSQASIGLRLHELALLTRVVGAQRLVSWKRALSSSK